MADQTQRVHAAAERIRREGVPPEAAEQVAALLDAHRQMTIGPADADGWPQGWLAVDKAQIDLADAVLGDGPSA